MFYHTFFHYWNFFSAIYKFPHFSWIATMPRFWSTFHAWAACKTETTRMTKTKWPLGVYVPPKCCFHGSCEDQFHTSTERSKWYWKKKKKSVIVLFNLPVFLLLSPSPFPPLDRNPALMTHGSRAELADTSSLVIGTAGKPRDPLDPLWTQEGRSQRWNLNRLRGTFR